MMRLTPLAIALLAGVAVVGSASGSDVRVANITSVGQVSRHAVVDWTLPAGVDAEALEIASKPDTGSDGHFFSENVKAIAILDKAQVHFVETSQLDYGTYYVHIESYDNECDYETHNTCLGWSPLVQLNIPRPPPPPPAPKPKVNQKPRITALSWSMLGHNAAGPNYYVTVTSRFRFCDDGPSIRVTRTERSWLAHSTFAKGSTWRVYPLNGCATKTWTWRLAGKYFGVGHYTVTLQASDAQGAKSNVISRDWYTSD